MCKIGNKKAVSAIIGVILMVAITVAIAATVYAFVISFESSVTMPPGDDDDDDNNSVAFYVEGWVIDAYSSGEYKEVDGKDCSIWYISLGANYDTEIGDTVLYAMVFLDGVSAPPEDVNLRFYHGEHDTATLMVYKVKSL